VVNTVIKRNGEIEKYNVNKIINAIISASPDNFWNNQKSLLSEIIADVEDKIIEEFDDNPTVEEIQDIVEIILIKHNLAEIAKSYILYRNKRNQKRAEAWLKSDIALNIWERKYQHDNESFDEFFNRVTKGKKDYIKVIRDKEFCPAGRILANRDVEGKKSSYSNCYYVPITEDSLEGIFQQSLYETARTWSYGGGVGVGLSTLRPRGAKVNNAAETTTGAVSFMKNFNAAAKTIGQKNRRAALLLSLEVDHPDIEEFIEVKQDVEQITKANISVKITDEFMEAVKNGNDFELYFKVEDTGEEIKKTVDPERLLNKMAYTNWYSGEPGALFKDRLENWHMGTELDSFGITGQNPCSELPLPNWGSCNLSSINLSKLVKNPFTERAEFDFEKLKVLTDKGIRFLDNIITENAENHPLEKQKEVTQKFRQAGLGVMGWASSLIKLGHKYGDDKSKRLAHRVGKTMINQALLTSALLAKEKGPFPAYEEEMLESEFIQENIEPDILKYAEKYGLRNVSLLSIAPTGSISTMYQVSGGIEPIFAISYERKTESIHEEEKSYKVYSNSVKQLMNAKNIYNEDNLPDYVVSTNEIPYEDRIEMQGIFQQYIDNAISSTINLPNEAEVTDVKDILMLSYEYGLKGVTIFRDNCKRDAILSRNDDTEGKQELNENDWIAIGICPDCKSNLDRTEGCKSCKNCGWSACTV